MALTSRAALAVAVVIAAGGACQTPEPRDPIAELFGSETSWVDLTYAFNDATIYWPTAEPFRLDVVSAEVTPAGFYYAANNFCAAEHGGTHLDAPIHFAAGRHTAEQVPVHALVGPAVVIDVGAQASADADYRVGVGDLEAFEAAHGRIPDGAIVLFRTGWGARWPDPASYLGTDRRGPEAVPLLHFPGIDSSAARWLVTSGRVDAVGIDTPSIDYGQSSTFEAHRILLDANIPAFENVAHLDRLPPTGAYAVALPMSIEGGSGGPARIVAAVPGVSGVQ